MEENQYNLGMEILRRLDNAGVLNNLIIIGSWCIPFYQQYFPGIKYRSTITTRDIDFLVTIPPKIKINVDIPGLLKDMGFIVGFKSSKGYIKLEHPDLVIEFLVPEKGRGSDKPYPLPQLGVNAQPLRFLNFLTDNLIHLKVSRVRITLPHPANFALHKLIISQRRTQKDKVSKDIESARIILQALIDKGEKGVIKKVFDSIPQKWQKKIIQGLKKIEQKEVLELLD